MSGNKEKFEAMVVEHLRKRQEEVRRSSEDEKKANTKATKAVASRAKFDALSLLEPTLLPSQRTDEEQKVIQNLVAIRTARGLSQSALAELCGISQAALSKIELGIVVPSLRTLCAISNGLGIPLATLLSSDSGELAANEEFEQLLDSTLDALISATGKLEELKARLKTHKQKSPSSKSKKGKN